MTVTNGEVVKLEVIDRTNPRIVEETAYYPSQSLDYERRRREH
jgi:hypothetical protein